MIYFTKYYETIKKFPLFNKLLDRFTFKLFRIIRSIFKGSRRFSKNILVISYNKLGDTVFTFPALEILQKNLKQDIIILCNPESKKIYEIYFESIIFLEVYPDDFYTSKRIAKSSLRKRIFSLNPEIIFDITGGLCSASMIFNSRAKIIIGINSQLLSGLYDRFMVPTFKDHLSEQYINLANLMLGKQFKYAQDNIVYKADSISKILIHPLAGWKAKEWNLSKFMKLGEILAKEYQVDFILPRGSFPKDILQEICLNNINVKITNSFEELISEIKSCCLLICNDSGPGHIAGVLGKPTFTIFGPTNPGFHLPLYNHHSFISKQIKCSPGATEKMCFTNGGREGCPSFECVNRLSVEDVLDKLLKFITELNSITAFDKIANQSNDLYYQSNI